MSDPLVSLERMRERARSRNAPIHDWRVTLLPAAIERRVSAGALRLCKALCDHQRGRFPEVIVGTEELAEELGVHRRNLWKLQQRLVRAGLVDIMIGGGRMPTSKTGRADVYQLGPACGRNVEAVVTASKRMQLSASKRMQYRGASRTPNSIQTDAPTLRGTSYPFGGSGERTAALTGGSSPDQPSPAAVPPHRFRELLGRFNPVNKGLRSAT
jgi:hypothetical protein